MKTVLEKNTKYKLKYKKVKDRLFGSLLFLVFAALFQLVSPQWAKAVDLSKGLQSQENYQHLAEFLRRNCTLQLGKAEDYPQRTFFSGIYAGHTINFDVSTDKATYRADESAKFEIKAKNQGFDSANTVYGPFWNNAHVYYIWASGNLWYQIVRIDNKVVNGEVEVAKGKVLSDDSIQLAGGEEKTFPLEWKLPENLKSGNYELRIFPVSANITFRGLPYSHIIPIRTSFQVASGSSQEDHLEWDLNKILVNGQKFEFSEAINYLQSVKDYKVSVPLRNNGSLSKEILVKKQIIGIGPTLLEKILDQEEENIKLNPQEEKTIAYNIPLGDIKDARVAIKLGYQDPEQNTQKTTWIVIPSQIIGNVTFNLSGIGIRTTGQSASFRKGDAIDYFIEINRVDPLFLSSGQRERGEEKNLDLDIKLLNPDGDLIDEIGYKGPSWDWAGMLSSKKIILKKDYDRLKLVGVLKDAGKEIARKEMEYQANSNTLNPEVGANLDLTGKIKNYLAESRQKLAGVWGDIVVTDKEVAKKGTEKSNWGKLVLFLVAIILLIGGVGVYRLYRKKRGH